MGTTAVFGFPYPEDETPNDLHKFFMDLASQVEASMIRQGALEQRPAAGKPGQFYWANTRIDPVSSAAVPWDVLYRDNGTAWKQVSPSARQAWSPTFSTYESTAYTINVTSTDAYYSVSAGRCSFSVVCSIGLVGGPASGGTVLMTLPVPSAVAGLPLSADIENDAARAFVFSGTQVALSSLSADVKFPADGIARYWRIAGEYWIN